MIPVVHFPDLPPPAHVVTIRQSPGGMIDHFEGRVRAYQRLGSFVRVTGECASACTMVLGLGDRICATATASFGFHQAFMPADPARIQAADVENRSEDGTAMMWSSYPAPVRAWIDERGGLTSRMIWLRGAEMRAIVPACD